MIFRIRIMEKIKFYKSQGMKIQKLNMELEVGG